MKIRFCQGKDKSEAARLEILSAVLGVAVQKFDDCTNADPLLDALERTPIEGDNILLFVHVTPFRRSSLAGGVGSLVSATPQNMKRMHMVLVSGDILANDEELEDAQKSARERGLGGFTWWPEGIDSAADSTALRIAVDAVQASLASRNLSFDGFHRIFNPDRDVAGTILDELTKSLAGDDDTVRRLNAWSADIAADNEIPSSVRRNLVTLAQSRRDWQVRRARLRHDVLMNQLAMALGSAINIAEGAVHATDSEAIVRIVALSDKACDEGKNVVEEFDSTMSPERLRDLGWKELSNSGLAESGRRWRQNYAEVVLSARASIALANEETRELEGLASSAPQSWTPHLKKLRQATERLCDALGALK